MHILSPNMNWVLSLILLLSINLSCQPQRQNDPFISGFELIDQGNYDEAIVYFENMLSEDPNNPKTKMALASAYVGRSGLIFNHEKYRDVLGRSDDLNTYYFQLTL